MRQLSQRFNVWSLCGPKSKSWPESCVRTRFRQSFLVCSGYNSALTTIAEGKQDRNVSRTDAKKDERLKRWKKRMQKRIGQLTKRLAKLERAVIAQRSSIRSIKNKKRRNQVNTTTAESIVGYQICYPLIGTLFRSTTLNSRRIALVGEKEAPNASSIMTASQVIISFG